MYPKAKGNLPQIVVFLQNFDSFDRVSVAGCAGSACLQNIMMLLLLKLMMNYQRILSKLCFFRRERVILRRKHVIF